MPNYCHQPIGKEVQLPSGCRRCFGKFLKRSVVLLLCLLFPTKPLVARLKLVRQSLKDLFLGHIEFQLWVDLQRLQRTIFCLYDVSALNEAQML